MGNTLLFPAILLIIQFILNILLSREIFYWIVKPEKRTPLLLLLWLLPVLGAILVYRIVRPEWFTRENKDPASGSSASSSLLAMDAIFNPGSNYIAQVKSKSEISIKMQGEMLDNELPECIDVKENTKAAPQNNKTAVGPATKPDKEKL